jgi:deferrochelatase/peroxidase EfeB
LNHLSPLPCRSSFEFQGAPVDLAPRFDDPALGADPTRNNNFTFSHPDAVLTTNQTRWVLRFRFCSTETDVEHRCPFAAHIRKVRPRADLGTPENTVRAIMRSGIPYGPEGQCPSSFRISTLTKLFKMEFPMKRQPQTPPRRNVVSLSVRLSSQFSC